MYVRISVVVLISCVTLGNSLFPSHNISEETDLGVFVLANVLYRHGDRTPVEPYPNDPYKNLSHWPVGWGQLTNIGKEQHFELGRWLRKRYSGFLPEEYSLEDIHVVSTDVDRTLMSAECNLAGLYPPNGSQVWDKELKWQPIPIHTVPEAMDKILAAGKPCPRYELELDKVKNSPNMRRLNKKNADLYAYLSKHSGSIVNDVVTLEYLYNVLYIEDLYNFTLPQWTQGVYPEKMLPLAAYSFKVQTLTKELQRLKSGLLLGEMISNMNKKTTDSLVPPRKMFVYSAHDTTVANLLNTLQVFDTQSPPYTSLVLIELRRNKRQDYQVTVSYRNSSSHDPYLLTIPGCTAICPLASFINLTMSVIPDDWESECELESTEIDFKLNTITVIAFFLSGFLSVLLLASIICTYLYWKKQTATSYYYHRVHSEG